MSYRMLDNWDIEYIKNNINDVDLLLDTIDDMLVNVTETSYNEGYEEGYEEGYGQGRSDSEEEYNEQL